MAEEKLAVVELRNEFYRDSFGRLVLIMVGFCGAIVLLILLSIYLLMDKPPPVTFPVSDQWRVQPPVPVDEPYMTTSDLLQWVNDTIRQLFVFDFNNYKEQLNVLKPYFTEDGWKVYLNQLNNYANYNNVQKDRLFINVELASAPTILQSPDPSVSGAYSWLVQVPIILKYAGGVNIPNKSIVLQVLVVRVPTLNNLNGVAIENMIVDQGDVKS